MNVYPLSDVTPKHLGHLYLSIARGKNSERGHHISFRFQSGNITSHSERETLSILFRSETFGIGIYQSEFSATSRSEQRIYFGQLGAASRSEQRSIFSARTRTDRFHNSGNAIQSPTISLSFFKRRTHYERRSGPGNCPILFHMDLMGLILLDLELPHV